MSTLAFDTLRYARRLKEAGVPEPQAEVQAELMAEAFGFYADNLLTKDRFTEVLNGRFAEQDARLEARFVEQEAKIDTHFAQQDAKFDGRFAKLERIQLLHAWMLGLTFAAVVLPQLRASLA